MVGLEATMRTVKAGGWIILLSIAVLVGTDAADPPAAAQEQHGSITGTVRDQSGAVLPGVTVEARSESGVAVSTVTALPSRTTAALSSVLAQEA